MSPTEPYPVTSIDEPLDAVVRPPGSKSLTNRALVAASLVAPGSVSRLVDPLEADDTIVMRDGLRALGVMIDDVDDPWLVLGAGGALTPGDIDAGASGTTARFLTAVAATVDGTVGIDGSARMRERPIGPLVDALVGLGAKVESAGGYPPLTVTGPVAPGSTSVSGAVSSQFLTALLLIAPTLGEQVTIEVTDGLVSAPYIAGTIEVVSAFGGSVVVDGPVHVVAPTGYRKTTYEVEADASAAVYPAVAAAVAGGTVAIAGIPEHSTQPDLAVLDHLVAMGCRVARDRGLIVVHGPEGSLDPVDVDLSVAPDGALGLAVACLFASGPSRLRGLGTLKVKETDRLTALATEIRRLGAGAEVDGDALVIHPRVMAGAEIQTYDDHRIAMSFSLAGLRVPGVTIADPGCVSKTWPGWFDVLEAMCRT